MYFVSFVCLSLTGRGYEPVTPGLQREWFIHYTTAAPIFDLIKQQLKFENLSQNLSGTQKFNTMVLCFVTEVQHK